MPFGFGDSGGLKEPCIRWGPDTPWEGVILRGERGAPYRDTLQPSVQKRPNRSRCRLGFWARMGPKNHVLDGGPAVLRDIAMTTNFGTNIAINWL